MRRLVLLLAATVFLLTGTAWAATPADPRIAGAVAVWAERPLYVDPDFISVTDSAETLRVISGAEFPVFVAVVPSGEWFPEKGDTELLAGRMAAANGKPGVYVVMDGTRTEGVAHQLDVSTPSWTYGEHDQPLSKQLTEFLDGVEKSRYSTPEPARTEPLPPEPEDSSPRKPEKFTVGTAIGHGLGGVFIGLICGAFLGVIALVVAAQARAQKEGRA
ncbi:hypothetical protein [Kribbella shirazensis]|uniref:TPM domain-containing protein n=1 Tax=Kribbella shirazensis TaxID=1105143 RepID=A0A7X5ZZB2_9ACTN|nr:hypothetical protein [Kribbella shirazensis]NIK55758.1 hypothetical protein [Kribbella shirazensis]